MKFFLPVRTTYKFAFFSLLVLMTPFISKAQPASDNCQFAAVLNAAGITCGTSTASTVVGATLTAGAPSAAPCAGGVVIYDVWFRFIAQTTNPLITLSGLGANFPSAANCKIQVLQGSCGAFGVPVGCATGHTYTPTGLTIGNDYYIRIFVTTGTAPATNGGFSICVTNPTLTDLCASAMRLFPHDNCTNVSANLTNVMTFTAGTPDCGAGNRDVWFQFKAEGANSIITVSGGTLTNTRIQLYSGGCGGLSSVACGNGSISASGLTIGATYFFRVYSSTNATGTFNVCVMDPPRVIGGGNSYVNVSKKTIGGIVQPGDTLEIRSSYYWRDTYDGGNNITRIRFYDSVPTNTTMLVPLNPAGDTLLRQITNEGHTLGSAGTGWHRYSYANNDDPGAFNLNPGGVGRYQIRMNLGNGNGNTPTTASGNAGVLTNTTGATGSLINPGTTRPRASSGTLITTSYYVTVNAGTAGQIIQLASSVLIYRKNSGVDTTIFGTPYRIIVSPLGSGLCPNTTGLNIASETFGTFGTGTTKERATTLTALIPAYNWRSVTNPSYSLNDGYYSIVNNLSPTGSTEINAFRQNTCAGAGVGFECMHRMHDGHWDIHGDHTGTTNSAGNAPPLVGSNAGYMLAVNADVVMSEAFRQTLNGLCPNTYYEYSAWLKNVCPTCGQDSSATQTFTPGVLPNLTFSVDGVDYYSSGSMGATAGWQEKGFIFQTGGSQITANVAIRNNAPGGGGNDWVLDDIGVATCFPNMRYSPTMNPTICAGTYISLNDTVNSFFSNYTHYKWQRSTNGGTIWNDIAGATGNATPVLVGSEWRYVTTYNVPPANTFVANNGDMYRVIVATTAANLSSANCQVTDGSSVINLNVIDCGIPLKTDLLSFNGTLVNNYSNLTWATSKEEQALKYHVERSTDGTHFTEIGVIDGYNNDDIVNQYSFVDPAAVSGKVYYRVIVINSGNNKKYTRIIQLSNQAAANFGLTNVINPFNQILEFDVTTSVTTKVDVELLDMFGKVIKRKVYLVQTGVNMLSLTNTETLPAGTYILRVRNNDQVLTKKVLKKNYQ
jgi:hypothetical protein